MAEPMEMMLAVICQSVWARGPGEARAPDEVYIAHARRHPQELYEEVFRVPVRFEIERHGVLVEAAQLDRPLSTPLPEVSAHLERQLRAYLIEEDLSEPEPTWRARLAWRLRAGMANGEVEQEQLARALGVSVRSMQRRLREEGTSYSEVLDEVRRARAMGMLAQTDCAVYEIVYALGYTEPSTLYRAFRRWTSMTPRQWRARQG